MNAPSTMHEPRRRALGRRALIGAGHFLLSDRSHRTSSSPGMRGVPCRGRLDISTVPLTLLGHCRAWTGSLIPDVHSLCDRAWPEALPGCVDTQRDLPDDLRRKQKERGTGSVLVDAEEDQAEREDQHGAASELPCAVSAVASAPVAPARELLTDTNEMALISPTRMKADSTTRAVTYP